MSAAAAPVGEPQTLLEVRNLTVEFPGGARAADGVSFKIRRGEVFGLVGESGSGKSTVVRSLIRLLPGQARVVSGEIQYGGRNLLDIPERRLHRVRGAEIGMIFQDPLTALNPVLPVGLQISEGLRQHERLSRSEARSRVVESMALVGLPDPRRLLRAYPHELSGGLRQRVAIAIALVSSPRLLLADEPTTALDVTIQDQILKLLVGLRDRLGMSIVLVTHDLGVVAQTCERVAVMYAGRIVETALVERLFASPAHPYTQALLESIPRGRAVDTKVRAIPGAPPDLDHLPAGCRFAPRCRFALDACRERDPRLEPHAPEQLSACIRHAELEALRRA